MRKRGNKRWHLQSHCPGAAVRGGQQANAPFGRSAETGHDRTHVTERGEGYTFNAAVEILYKIRRVPGRISFQLKCALRTVK
jgi:hypothetical protein